MLQMMKAVDRIRDCHNKDDADSETIHVVSLCNMYKEDCRTGYLEDGIGREGFVI
jgi:hypothetical protein